MDTSGINNRTTNASLQQAMQIHRLAKSKVVEQYQSQHSDLASLPPLLRHVANLWQSLGDANVLSKVSDLSNIRISLQHIHDHFASDQHPLLQRYGQTEEYKGFLNRIKPGGRFDRDIQEEKYDHNPNARRNTMRQMAHYTIELDKTSRTDIERAFETLSYFPSPREEDWQCAGGTGSRLLQARSMLLNMPDNVLLGPYQSIKAQLHSQLKGIISEGDEVHIPQALDALFGIPFDVIQKSDPQFSVPFAKISSPNVWQAYRQSLQMGLEIASIIKDQALQAVMIPEDQKTKLPPGSITNANEKMYLKPWSIARDDLYKPDLGLYDEFSLPNKNVNETDEDFSERVSNVLANKMSYKLNQSLFGDDTQQHIAWLSLPNVNLQTIPDSRGLLHDNGRQWITAQVQRGVNEAVEPPELEIALNAMLIMAERTYCNYPVMVLKALHELGGEGPAGIQQGVAMLNRLKEKLPERGHFVDRINDLTQQHLQSQYREYGEFLRGVASAPLLTMYIGGGSREELHQAIAASDGARLNETDANGCTLLFIASGLGEVDLVRTLLDKSEVLLNHQAYYGFTPLSIAVQNNHIDVVNALVDNLFIEVNKTDQFDRTPLMIAAEKGHVRVMDTLLQSRRCRLDEYDQAERTALIIAAEFGQVASVELLLSYPVSTDHQDNNGRTALNAAASMGNTNIVERILQHGTHEVNVADNEGRTPLLIAAERGDLAAVNALLVCQNLDLNKVDNDGLSPLMAAAENSRADIVIALLNHSLHPGQVPLDPNADGEHGFTALHYAASKNRADIVWLLANNLAFNVNVNCADHSGETPLYWAAETNNYAIVELLAEHPSIEINKANELNMTPLWIAAKNGQYASVHKLLERGADKTIRDNGDHHMSPEEVARDNGHHQIARLIASYRSTLARSNTPQLNRNPDTSRRDGDGAPDQARSDQRIG